MPPPQGELLGIPSAHRNATKCSALGLYAPSSNTPTRRRGLLETLGVHVHRRWPIHTYVFWDIDGTLVSTGGAGLRAWQHAMTEVLGRDDGLTGFRTSGMSDAEIAVWVCHAVGAHAADVREQRRDVAGDECRHRHAANHASSVGAHNPLWRQAERRLCRGVWSRNAWAAVTAIGSVLPSSLAGT
jgi:hypothetical protein